MSAEFRVRRSDAATVSEQTQHTHTLTRTLTRTKTLVCAQKDGIRFITQELHVFEMIMLVSAVKKWQG